MRIICKVGTRLVTNEDHTFSETFIPQITQELASLFEERHEISIVSSGAVSAGRGILCPREKKSIPYRQVLAAVGQGMLIDRYRDAFLKYGIHTAQALLTNYDFVNRESFLNTQHVLELLFQQRIVPIINENDVTTISELTFGDNDMLAAKTAVLVSADLLILLTSVDGLFTDDPRKNPEAEPIRFVSRMTEGHSKMAKGSSDKDSIGGMSSKVRSAEYAASSGVSVFIGNGLKTNICREAVACFSKKSGGDSGTFFLPTESKVQSFKKWLKPKIVKDAGILVDEKAAKILREEGKSLLSVGIIGIQGKFGRGDVVMVKSPEGNPVCYGQVNYSSDDLLKLRGKKSSEIEKILGHRFEEEVIHRDHMVVV